MTKKYQVSVRDNIGLQTRGGKTITCSIMRIHDSGECVLFYNEAKDLIASVPTRDCVVVLIDEEE